MKKIRFPLLLLALVSVGFPLNAAVTVHNATWTVTVVPETLAIVATPAGQRPVTVSSGGPARGVAALDARDAAATWDWPEEGYAVRMRLDGSDLVLQISATRPGTLPLLRQPAAALGKAIMLPLAEGAYVPATDTVWRSFLLQHMDRFNTSQDISLPLWGTDHGAYTLNWILTQPFGNQMGFVADGRGMALTLDHAFTANDVHQPMTLMLHLGAADPLAASKRYQRWLIDTGRYEPLAGKLAALPAAERLIGAAHVYLWGNGLLAPRDVRNWPALLATLRQAPGLPARLRAALDTDAASVLASAGNAPDRYQQQVLIGAINAGLDAQIRARWQTPTPDLAVMVASYGVLRQDMARSFTAALQPDPAHWGSGLSINTLHALREAGLERLWLGLGDGWGGGLWHPEAVQHGVDAGYLLAPYDSYQTAAPASATTSWSTTQLGNSAYTRCAITLGNGRTKAGFQEEGHYTRPDCVRPLLRARIGALQAAVPFNSWFLDAYATGMVFDSQAPGEPMTQAENAEGNIASLRWVGETAGLVVGSEDGNATTAGGVVFAHGMQTPVIGWGDPQMHTQRTSPYFVGAWYPEEQPQVFFRQVPLREPFRTVHFAPASRLPLYQAVFHGSVITTHHWLYDSLKLTNVRADSELVQLLYNVPPLYHLSAATLPQRLPAMVRQDTFFRPLHQRLATQALVGFRWLDDARKVQETRFADGTRLVANFTGAPVWMDGVRLPRTSIAAFVPGQRAPVLYQVAADPGAR
ncbi:glycoside hydrolase [Bacillus subtilis subsp. subtilis]|nr:glycoside hydrolase [Bacillus subtilis subsp. subtilis]